MPGIEISSLPALFCFTGIILFYYSVNNTLSPSLPSHLFLITAQNFPLFLQVLGDSEGSNLTGNLIPHFGKTQAYGESTNIFKRQMAKFVHHLSGYFKVGADLRAT